MNTSIRKRIECSLAKLLVTILFLTNILRVVLFFVLFAFQSQAQMVLNDVLCLDKAPVVFDPEFIKSHHIKSIKGKVSTKKPNSPIRNTNLFCIYFFDSLGRITHSYEVFNQRDTLYREYFYNDKGKLFYQGAENSIHLVYETYLMDEFGRIVEINEFDRRKDHMGIPVTTEGKMERYEFEKKDSSSVKILKNKQNTPFMKEETFYRANGTMDRIEKRYITTGEGMIQYYDYDTKGKVISITWKTTKQKIEKEKYLFEYDRFGNLMSKKHFENGTMVKETQYIVNETNGLLTALIEQDGLTNHLRIIRFESYEYFD